MHSIPYYLGRNKRSEPIDSPIPRCEVTLKQSHHNVSILSRHLVYAELDVEEIHGLRGPPLSFACFHLQNHM